MSDEYIYTDSKNVISRKSHISGSKHIVLAGSSLIEREVVLRGDRSQDGKPVIQLGKFCVLRQNSVLDPPKRRDRFHPQKIGSYVYIGENTRVRAASVGSCVIIGDNCNVGQFAIIKDGVVIPSGTTVPEFAVLSTSDLPESAPEVIQRFCQMVHAGIDEPVPFGAGSSGSGS